MSDTSKTSWPEVEGLPGDVAKQKILVDRPDVHVDVLPVHVNFLPVGSIVTDDFDIKRVRVFVNRKGNVAKGSWYAEDD
nr:unnamed protein product [Digitaria exilis]